MIIKLYLRLCMLQNIMQGQNLPAQIFVVSIKLYTYFSVDCRLIKNWQKRAIIYVYKKMCLTPCCKCAVWNAQSVLDYLIVKSELIVDFILTYSYSLWTVWFSILANFRILNHILRSSYHQLYIILWMRIF